MPDAYSTTGIGSMPHLNMADAFELIFGTCDIPFWPQFPKKSFKEFMIPQYSEGMPFLKIDDERQIIWVEKDGSDELDRFYESWTEESRIAISEDYAKGFHLFLKFLKEKAWTGYVKGQITGPLTYTLGLKDSAGKPVYFDEELREICLMLLKAKTRWQIENLKGNAEGVIIFIDEPIFSALGSPAYMAVKGDETLRLLQELIRTIKSAGALAGIHCCGNADWPLIIRTGADIINFDAYDYIDTVALYPLEFREFFDKGGWLAWGVIPTSDLIRDANPEGVRRRFQEGIEKMSSHIHADVLQSRLMLTPSCGTASRTISETLKIFQLLIGLKESLA